MDLGIAGKTALVCASSQGLGKACAVSLSSEGVHVFINGRTLENLEATADAILAASQTLGLVPVPDRPIQPWEPEPERVAFELAEVVLAPSSRFRGQTLRQMDFRSRFGLAVLAIRQQGQTLFARLGDIALDFGD